MSVGDLLGIGILLTLMVVVIWPRGTKEMPNEDVAKTENEDVVFQEGQEPITFGDGAFVVDEAGQGWWLDFSNKTIERATTKKKA